MTSGTEDDATEENHQGANAASSALEAAGEAVLSLDDADAPKHKQDSKQDGEDTLEANSSALKNTSGP